MKLAKFVLIIQLYYCQDKLTHFCLNLKILITKPTTWQGQLVCICYALLGVPLFLISIANLSGVFADSFRYAYANWFCYACKKDTSGNNQKKKVNEDTNNEKLEDLNDLNVNEFSMTAKAKVIDDEEEEESEENEQKKKVNVPLIIILFVLFGYIFFGGWIFSLVEAWTLVQGTYFSFISVFTIGNKFWAFRDVFKKSIKIR